VRLKNADSALTSPRPYKIRVKVAYIPFEQKMKFLPIKAVLFDLDDTLWPIAPVISRAEIVLYDWLKTYAPTTADRFSIDSMCARRLELMAMHPHYQIDLWGLRHAVLCEALSACGDDVALAESAMAVFSEARNAVTPFGDVLPGLQRLSGKVALGSISNGFADLDAIGMAQHFQVSLAAHSCGTAKPDPAIFHLACDALKIAPAEAVYVGDDLLLDVEASQKAGLRAVWMNRFGRTAPSHIEPDAECMSLIELEDWLTKRLR
jgi:HAD superfamily hydrolase (TIGR01549 family)